jgi:hypothetical protein
VLGEHFPVGARLVVEAVEVGVGDDLEEVLVAFEVLGDESVVVVGLALGVAADFSSRGLWRRRSRNR